MPLETLTDLTELRDWLKDAERLAVGLHTEHDPIPMVLAMRNLLPGLLDAVEAVRAHLLDAIARNGPEGNGRAMDSVRAALAALEGGREAGRAG